MADKSKKARPAAPRSASRGPQLVTYNDAGAMLPAVITARTDKNTANLTVFTDSNANYGIKQVRGATRGDGPGCWAGGE